MEAKQAPHKCKMNEIAKLKQLDDKFSVVPNYELEMNGVKRRLRQDFLANDCHYLKNVNVLAYLRRVDFSNKTSKKLLNKLVKFELCNTEENVVVNVKAETESQNKIVLKRHVSINSYPKMKCNQNWNYISKNCNFTNVSNETAVVRKTDKTATLRMKLDLKKLILSSLKSCKYKNFKSNVRYNCNNITTFTITICSSSCNCCQRRLQLHSFLIQYMHSKYIGSKKTKSVLAPNKLEYHVNDVLETCLPKQLQNNSVTNIYTKNRYSYVLTNVQQTEINNDNLLLSTVVGKNALKRITNANECRYIPEIQKREHIEMNVNNLTPETTKNLSLAMLLANETNANSLNPWKEMNRIWNKVFDAVKLEHGKQNMQIDQLKDKRMCKLAKTTENNMFENPETNETFESNEETKDSDDQVELVSYVEVDDASELENIVNAETKETVYEENDQIDPKSIPYKQCNYKTSFVSTPQEEFDIINEQVVPSMNDDDDYEDSTFFSQFETPPKKQRYEKSAAFEWKTARDVEQSQNVNLLEKNVENIDDDDDIRRQRKSRSVLRLGLSRRQKLKPLHQNVKRNLF